MYAYMRMQLRNFSLIIHFYINTFICAMKTCTEKMKNDDYYDGRNSTGWVRGDSRREKKFN